MFESNSDQQLATWIFGSISFAVLLWIVLFGPKELPPFRHNALGILLALLCGLFAYFLTGTVGLTTEGNFSGWGKVGIQAAGGVALFVFVLLWWNSEASPIISATAGAKNGSIAVKNIGSGDVTVINGYPIEEHERRLKEREHEIRKELATEFENHSFKAQLLKKELADVKHGLFELKSSYEAKILSLSVTVKQLKHLKGDVSDQKLDEAIAALKTGDSSKADALFAQIEQTEQASIERVGRAAFERGRIARDKFRYADAFDRFKRSVELVPENTEYLKNAASAAYIVAAYDLAIEWNENALNIIESQHNENHPDLATIRNDLGVAWHDKGNYDKAIKYYMQALDSDLKNFDEDHPNVAIYWNNLAMAWQDKGNYDKAIEYYEKALDSGLKNFDNEHPLVATYRNNLGMAWHDKGDYDTAIQYYTQALSSSLKNFDDNHPNVATYRSNLGMAWQNKRNYDKAIGYYMQALDSDLKNFDDDHPNVARDRNNLGSAWRDKGNPDKAIEYHTKALNSWLKAFNEGHPNVARALNNLGKAWQDKGDYKKAVNYYMESLSKLHLTLGENHPFTIKVQSNLDAAIHKRDQIN